MPLDCLPLPPGARAASMRQSRCGFGSTDAGNKQRVVAIVCHMGICLLVISNRPSHPLTHLQEGLRLWATWAGGPGGRLSCMKQAVAAAAQTPPMACWTLTVICAAGPAAGAAAVGAVGGAAAGPGRGSLRSGWSGNQPASQSPTIPHWYGHVMTAY